MIPALLVERASTAGDDSFLVHRSGTASWAQTVDTVARLATQLAHIGVRQGDRVLLAAGNNPTFCYLWFAIRWLGATCVPLHGAATSAGIRDVVADCSARFVVGDPPGAARVADSGALDAARIHAFPVDGLHRLVAAERASEPVSTGPADESSLIYTSGTTGRPKGAVLSNACLVQGGRRLAQALDLSRDDRMMLALPLFHTNPQVYGVMTALSAGGSIAIADSFEAANFFQQAAEFAATGFTYVGTVLTRLLRAGTPEVGHRPRLCVGGGAPAAIWEAVEERFGVAVHEVYGMTETGGWVTCNVRGRRRVGSVGTVRPDMSLVVLDDRDRAVPTGCAGQIAVRPEEPHVIFDGYLGRDGLTLSTFTNLWFHTGDVGRLDADGYLYFLGRVDDVIRRGGENVTPADVEAVLASHDTVEEVAVIGVPDDELGQEVKAVVVPRDGFQPEHLLDACAESLPHFAWPRLVELRAELPKTLTEKVRATELRRRLPTDVDLRPAIRARLSLNGRNDRTGSS